MTVHPNRLASAIAAIYGFTRPRPLLSLRHLPCPTCDGGLKRMFTICPNCNGHGRVMEIR